MVGERETRRIQNETARLESERKRINAEEEKLKRERVKLKEVAKRAKVELLKFEKEHPVIKPKEAKKLAQLKFFYDRIISS